MLAHSFRKELKFALEASDGVVRLSSVSPNWSEHWRSICRLEINSPSEVAGLQPSCVCSGLAESWRKHAEREAIFSLGNGNIAGMSFLDWESPRARNGWPGACTERSTEIVFSLPVLGCLLLQHLGVQDQPACCSTKPLIDKSLLFEEQKEKVWSSPKEAQRPSPHLFPCVMNPSKFRSSGPTILSQPVSASSAPAWIPLTAL